MNAQRIEGAVALVTGANRGIGRALTEALLSRGVKKIYATARDPESLRVLRDERLVTLELHGAGVDQIRAGKRSGPGHRPVLKQRGRPARQGPGGLDHPQPGPPRDGGQLLRASAAA